MSEELEEVVVNGVKVRAKYGSLQRFVRSDGVAEDYSEDKYSDEYT